MWGEAIGFDLGFEGFGVVMHSDLVQRERERESDSVEEKEEREDMHRSEEQRLNG